MVPIFTYRDERKLFALVATIIVAAVIAIVQLDALKTGRNSIIAVAAGTVAVALQTVVAGAANGVRSAASAVADVPRYYGERNDLDARVRALAAENARLREALAQAPDARAIADAATDFPGAVAATVIGYDPENLTRTIALDRGSEAGVKRDDGVLDPDGVVGRIVDVEPYRSTALLIVDGGSKVPAVVQRGRWWGIATGTNGRVRLEYVSQDAKLKVGDAVVTGEGRSFHAGLPVGRIVRVDHPEGGLYQTASIEPAVAFGRLSRVLIVGR